MVAERTSSTTSVGSAVEPSSISSWQFAHTSTHLSSSSRKRLEASIMSARDVEALQPWIHMMEGQCGGVPPVAAQQTSASLVVDHPQLQFPSLLGRRPRLAARVAAIAGHSATRREREAPAAAVAHAVGIRVVSTLSLASTVGFELKMAVRADEHAAIEFSSKPLPAPIVGEPAALLSRVEMVEVHRAQAPAVSAEHTRSALVLDHPLLQEPPVTPAIRSARVALPCAMPLVPVVHVAAAAALANAGVTEHMFDGSWRPRRQRFAGSTIG